MYHFVILVILSSRNLKKHECMERLSPNSPSLPKDISSKWDSIVINAFPGSFINQGGLTLVTGEETKSRHHSQKNCHTFHLPSILLKTHSSFLRIIYSSLRGCHFSSPFLIKMMSNPASKPPWGVTDFSHVFMLIKLFIFLLLICPLLQGSQARTQKGRGKIIFPLLQKESTKWNEFLLPSPQSSELPKL